MYVLYDKFCKGRGVKPKSCATYFRVLRDMKISVFRPKKDRCKTCVQYENLTGDAKSAFEPKYATHLALKDSARNAKDADKQRSKAEKSFHSINFDLQAVLFVPSGNVSSLFYKRKLSTYNFTICDQSTNDGYCYYWSEVDGNRGAIEIATCLFHYITNLSSDVKHLAMFSHTCGGQNRNQYVCAALLVLVRSVDGPDVIDQKFLEPGHTQMECDSMHSCIESAAKDRAIYVPNDWFNVIGLARPKQPFARVRLLTYSDFYDFKRLAVRLFGNKRPSIPFTSTRHFRFEKQNPNTIQHRSSFQEDFSVYNLPPARTRQQQEIGLEAAYASQLPVSEKKKADLMQLCESAAIPELYWRYYERLKVPGTCPAEEIENIDEMDPDSSGDSPEDESDSDELE